MIINFKKWLNTFSEWNPPKQKFSFMPAKSQLSTEIKLYHATPYMEEIENFGMKAKSETGISTFGSAGASDEKTISVTPLYENAYKYAKALKLLASAAQGKIKIENFATIIKLYKPRFDYYEPKNQYLDQIFSDHGRSWYESVEMTNKVLNYLKNNKEEPPKLTSQEELEVVTVMMHSLGLYTENRFPWIIMQKGYKNQIKMYQNYKLENIGVVELHLKEPIELDYLHGEQEFRIPPDKLIVYSFRDVQI